MELPAAESESLGSVLGASDRAAIRPHLPSGRRQGEPSIPHRRGPSQDPEKRTKGQSAARISWMVPRSPSRTARTPSSVMRLLWLMSRLCSDVRLLEMLTRPCTGPSQFKEGPARDEFLD